MNGWSLVTLELAPTVEEPRGSVCRGYIMRVPLKATGRIDEALVDCEPRRATIRRFWPGESDLSGYLVRARLGWRACDITSPETDCSFAEWRDCAFEQGTIIEITGPDDRTLPYIVADIQAP